MGEEAGYARQGCCPRGAIDFWWVGEVYLITSSILVVTALGGPCCRLLSYESRPFHPSHPHPRRAHTSFPAAPSFFLRLTLVWPTNLKGRDPRTGSRVYPFRRLFAFYPAWHLQQSCRASWGVVVIGDLQLRAPGQPCRQELSYLFRKIRDVRGWAGFYDVCTTTMIWINAC